MSTARMRVGTAPAVLSLAATILAATILAGCGSDAPGDAVTPAPGTTTPTAFPITPSATASPSPSPSVDPTIVLAADGIGPYVIGTSLAELQSRALVTGVFESPHCDNAHGAEATGRYARQLTFSFRYGRLVVITTDSPVLQTPSGARVGMTVAQLQEIYAARGTLITGTPGNKAFLVRVPASGLAVVFFLDSTNTKTRAIGAGEAQPLELAVRTGEGC